MKCEKCNKYTMEDICPVCREKTANPKPAKYDPEDPYAEYRRKAKEEEHKKEGLL